jgi:lysine 2,3-aminomutase
MQTSGSSSESEVSDDKPPSPVAEELADPYQQAERSAKLAELIGNGQRNDWRWQMRNRIRSIPQLMQLFPSLHLSTGMVQAAQKFPMAVTPYYASLIRRFDETDPIFRMCIPQAMEMQDGPFLCDDPLEEDRDMPVPGLVHRYADRALLLATMACSTYCRHCTRKRIAGSRETPISSRRLQQVTAYLNAHPEISDVIVSGGDPFTMSTDSLEAVLAALRAVPSVQIIRIGTRVPVAMPMRVTAELTAMLRRYHPVWVNTHFNHPAELTSQAATACEALVDAGIPLGNQSVLLRGVNDSPAIVTELCRGLVRMRVRPYYLFQCDLVRGVEHFRTPLSRGLEIMEYLRGRISGLAIPTFVVDAPHGGGKIPLLPNYIVSTSPTHTVLRNFEGMMVSYPEPGATPETAPPQTAEDGVWDLACGRVSKIQPIDSGRRRRRIEREESLEESPSPRE